MVSVVAKGMDSNASRVLIAKTKLSHLDKISQCIPYIFHTFFVIGY